MYQVRIEIEELVPLNCYKIMRGRWAPSVVRISAPKLTKFKNHDIPKTYPAMPIDWGSRSDALSDSQ